MPNTSLAVGSLGGTITMTPSAAADGLVQPSLTADALVASAPDLADLATISATTLETSPGASLVFPALLRALAWARDAVDNGACGALLIQGTDTMEETAYLLDLYWDRPEPLVITGAMRPPHVPGSDAAANLLAAARTAVAPASRDIGVLLVMNDEVQAAARVRKSHSTGVDAFTSNRFGPVGVLHEGEVVYAARPPRWPAIRSPRDDAAPRVALLETSLGDDGGVLDLVAGARYDGVVVGAFGAGHVSAGYAEAVSRAQQACPVVVASRTGAGSTLRCTYGFTGSESDLAERGAILAGWLDARKARLLLWALLACGSDLDGIRAEFARRGALPFPAQRDRPAHVAS